MMKDTILFDLDGTLLQFSQKEFVNVYLGEIAKVFVGLGLDAGASVKALWAGTKAMVLNDGSMPNAGRFWGAFSGALGLTDAQAARVEAACDGFYANEFEAVRSVLKPSAIAERLVRAMASKGYTLVLATNPLFPLCGVETRLRWAGLCAEDFLLVTHYQNSTYCKPNLGYYREILGKIGKAPEQCLMAGNSPAEDMVAGTLGMETFLVTDCLENETDADISVFRSGTLAELETVLMSRNWERL